MKTVDTIKKFDYVGYDKGSDYYDEGLVVECSDDRIIIESIRGNRRVFTKSDFKHIYKIY